MLHEHKICPAITLPAEVTPSSLSAFEQDLGRHLDLSTQIVEVDCSELTRITSGHIGMLWRAHTRCAEIKAAVHLLTPSSGLMRILEAMDLREMFRIGIVMQTSDDEITVCRETDALTEYDDEYHLSVIDIDNAIDRLVAFLSQAGVPALIIFDLRTICYEVSTNIRLHAKMECSQTISLNAIIGDDVIMLSFTDRGPAFDLTASAKKLDGRVTALKRQYHGFGIAMILRLSDRMKYAREEGLKNVLTIEKYWRKRP